MLPHIEDDPCHQMSSALSDAESLLAVLELLPDSIFEESDVAEAVIGAISRAVMKVRQASELQDRVYQFYRERGRGLKAAS